MAESSIKTHLLKRRKQWGHSQPAKQQNPMIKCEKIKQNKLHPRIRIFYCRPLQWRQTFIYEKNHWAIIPFNKDNESFNISRAQSIFTFSQVPQHVFFGWFVHISKQRVPTSITFLKIQSDVRILSALVVGCGNDLGVGHLGPLSR